MTDIEIARNTKLENITKIAKKLGITEDEIEQYRKYCIEHIWQEQSVEGGT